MTTICFYAQFTGNKLGVNSLTVTWDIERVTRADGTRTALVTGGANGITVGRRGLYGYVLTNADLTLYDYIATAITATTTVDLQEVPALWTLWSISWHDIATSIMSAAGSIGKLFVDNIDTALSSIKTTAAEFWAYQTRTLTQSAAQVAAIVEGDEITITNSATITIALTGLGSLAGANQIWFCAKRNRDADDSAARFLVALDGGLLVTNGSTGVAGDGSLAINDASAGNITITVKPAGAALIASGTGMHWDVKAKYSADDVRELSSGVINIVQAVTHAVQ